MINVVAQRLLKYSLQQGNRVVCKLRLPRKFYFAFGANMNADFLRNKRIYPASSTPAILMGTKISISSPCEYIGKGFASVEEAKGEQVFGVVHDVSIYEALILDVLEWVPFRFHRRQVGLVTTLPNGLGVSVFYYVAVSPQNDLKTSVGYRDLLTRAALEFNFPAFYQTQIKDLPVDANFELDHGFRLSNPAKRRWMEHRLRSLYRTHDRWREKLCQLLP